jgi:diguanylate cyclase (GGDEF)-like protein
LRLEEAHALFAMALACRSMSKLKDCFNYAFDALKLFESYNNQECLAGALNLIGVVYFYNGLCESALEYFLKALHLLETTEDYLTMCRIFNNIGEVYREVGNLEEALVYYNKALDLCENNDYLYNLAVVLLNKGEIYFIKKDYTHSYTYYKKSYEILINENDLTAISEVENRIGQIHFIQKEYAKARECYNSALARFEKIENKFYIIDVLINLADLEMLENEELVLNILVKAISYSDELNARKKLSQIYKMITKFYERKGDYELSLEFYKRYHLIEREIDTTMISKKLEIIKLELSKLFTGEEVEKITKLNKQLEIDITNQNQLLKAMEKTNRNLSIEVLLDELTNIPNRRGVKDFLSSVWAEGEVKPFNSSLLMIDVDYFKRYNDYHGHLEGDNCIKKIAACLKETFGIRDGVLGRYGGEEFVCFIKDVEYNEVLELSEKLRNSIEKLNLEYIWNTNRYSLTISIGGVYGCLSNFSSIHDMYSIADEELYRAKNQGRNKVFFNNKNIIQTNLI